MGCPTTVAVEATGSLVVAFVDPFPQNTLMRLDPLLGRNSIVASRGPTLPPISSIAVEPTGTFVVVDLRLNAVARINEHAGGSGPLSQMRPRAVDRCFSASGTLRSRLQEISSPWTLCAKRIIRINPVTGARTIVPDATIGSGPALFAPSEIAVEPTGTLVVAYRAQGSRYGSTLSVATVLFYQDSLRRSHTGGALRCHAGTEVVTLTTHQAIQGLIFSHQPRTAPGAHHPSTYST